MLDYLDDDIHTEVFIGGAAGGAKSFTGCYWQIKRRLKYANSRGFLARAQLKSLKESTLLTFFEVCRMLNLRFGIDFKYNSVNGLITFFNGSEEYLRDLFLYPSDPEFVSLGSTEYTDGFIDEMAEIKEQAYQIIRSRIRYKLDEFGLIPKICMGSNPCKTFIYREFYKKWVNKTLEKYKKYIPSKVYDNPFMSDLYIENLKKLDKRNKERLLKGNWEYDDDPAKLMEYEAILDIFTNKYVMKESENKYITCDPARFGQDLTVIYLWYGLYIKKVYVYQSISTEQTEQHLQKLMNDEEIPRSRVIVDEDGIGGGIVDHLPGIKGFTNNAKALYSGLDKSNYRNLKTQCYYKLSDYVNAGKIGANFDNSQYKDFCIEDLEQVKRKDHDVDGKLQIIPKKEVKENLGRSCDFSDCMMMRIFFELDTRGEIHILEDPDNLLGLK